MIINYFKLNNKSGFKELLFLLILMSCSIFVTYIFVYLVQINFETFSYNIFNVIELERWIKIFLAGVFLIALIRPLIFTLLIKIKVIENYFPLFIHIIKYGLFSMPFFILSIMITLNNRILEMFTFEYNNNLNILLVITFSFFFILWIFFLGTTIKSSLMQKYSFFKSFVKNISVSVITSLVLTGVSFIYIIDIEKYEDTFYNSILELHIDKNRISMEQKEIYLRILKQNKNEEIN